MTRLAFAVLLLLGLGAPAGAADLTLKHVMLSSGGVGYFEYAAEIDGDATLGLDVPLGQVDDILKSLVVFDQAGGVAGVELPGRDNTVQAFGDAPFGPEALQSPIAYLTALSGTEVTVQGPRPMTGRIVSAEQVTETTGKTSTPRTRVTLLSADGLRQFVLEDADTIQVTDPALRTRIERALESLRRDASLTTRHLTIRIKGNAKRQVAVGYVAGAPLWKATYRLMLAAAPSSTARLQGWATLENQSGADWKGVTLTLQYGNPVTFRQSLYRSYFVQRPEVPVEILGHVLPVIDTRARDEMQNAMAPAPAPMVAPPGMAMEKAGRTFDRAAFMAAPADAALANETAEETIFTLTQPVDLEAGHTANVPIIDREFPATRIGLVPYRQMHPLAAIRLRNDSSQSLPAGVLTLYDRGSFAGDARLGGLPAGETRLLSFAQDLRATIDTKESSQPNTFIAFSVADGVLTYTVRTRKVIHIDVTAPAKEPRDLLLEIPKSNADQTLTLEDNKLRVTEQTATAFRIALSLAPGESRSVTAWLDQPVRQTVALVGGNDAVLQTIIGEDKLNAAGRAALGHVLELRRDKSRKQAEVAQQQKLLNDVQQDEDRIRKNLAAVTSADPLRARLTKALDADETRIEQLRKAIDDAQADADKAHRALADAVAALHI
jgi:hypothetical protein